jgi:hypothetical protein
MLCDQFDNRGANHYAIGNACDVGGLFRRADAKAYGDGQVCVRLEVRDSFINACLCGDL